MLKRRFWAESKGLRSLLVSSCRGDPPLCLGAGEKRQSDERSRLVSDAMETTHSGT